MQSLYYTSNFLNLLVCTNKSFVVITYLGGVSGGVASIPFARAPYYIEPPPFHFAYAHKREADDGYIEGQVKGQNRGGKTSHGDSEDLVPGLLGHGL